MTPQQYVNNQIHRLLQAGLVQATDGSWHYYSAVLAYENKSPMLTPKQRVMKLKFAGKAFFTHDNILYFSSAEALIGSMRFK